MSVSLVVTIILVLGAILVNGWTDAPNAIATAIGTRVLKPKTAIIMAVICNFLGAFVMTLINSQVAETISNIVVFEGDGNAPQVALAAALFAIVTWAVVAWMFAIPTSESHALIAGLTGAAMALTGIDAVNMNEWKKVIIGLFLSTVLGLGGGFLITKLIQILFFNVDRRKANHFFTAGQAIGAGANAFLHGVQDGQKFMGVFMLALFYNNVIAKNADGTFNIELWVIVLCSAVMGLGTSVGGSKIIKSVGMDMVDLEVYQGFSADLSTAIVLLGCSILGIPVSTTHTKTTSIMGVGAARRMSSVNWTIVKEMVIAWVLTFPGCGLIAFIMAKIFVAIF